MENLLNKIITIILLFIMTFGIFSCNNSKENNANIATDKSIIVDTLGGEYERVVNSYYGDTVYKQIFYLENDSSYYDLTLWPTGEKYIEGWIKDGEREDKWVSWYKNGKIWSYAIYLNGKREGLSEIYHENGKLRIKQYYEHGLPDSTWQFYESNGDLILDVVYKNGEKITENRY